MSFLSPDQLEELVELAAEADRRTQEDLRQGDVRGENDYTSAFLARLRDLIQKEGKTGLSAKIYKLDGGEERSIGADASIILSSGQKSKVAVFEAKWPRFSKLKHSWDFEAKKHDGAKEPEKKEEEKKPSHFSSQLKRQAEWANKAAVFEIIYSEHAAGEHPDYLIPEGSSCVWHEDAVAYDAKRPRRDEAWSQTELQRLLREKKLSLAEVLQAFGKCEKGKPLQRKDPKLLAAELNLPGFILAIESENGGQPELADPKPALDSPVNESTLEDETLEWFRELGYDTAPGTDLSPDAASAEREDYRQVVLRKRLLEAVGRLNPGIPLQAVEDAVHVVCTLNEPSLIQKNRAFHKLLLEGVRVEFTHNEEKKVEHLRIVDFHDWGTNDFLVANQFTITGTKQLRRPDIVVFVNGLPLSVLELKNLGTVQVDLWDAYDQLQTYKEEISDLFIYNQALIASDGITARVGSLTATKEWFMPWRAISGENDRPKLQYELEVLVRGFFNPELFLCYIRFFVLYEQNGDKITKKIAGYHQFHGVREAVRVTLIAAHRDKDGIIREERAAYGREVVPGSKKAGVFWQTQGSGKSISMVCYAGMLIQQPEMNNPTIVVVTDRNDLDGQLYQQFSSAKDLLKQTPEQAESREELREKLAAREAGGIIFTTVQKFSLLEGEKNHPKLCERGNVVVISDEAHRTQYGLSARLVDVKDKQTKEVIGKKYVFGYAKHMRDALPEASFIGFTGTPISSEDRDTQTVFGGYVSVYDIQDAVNDGATVPIYYESRLARLDINRAAIDELNEEVEEVIEDEEDVAAREKTKSKWAELAKLVGADPRLEQVAADLVAHYETRTSAIEGKAMIVCMSRDICVELFDKIIALRPEWAGTKLTKDGKAIGYNPDDGCIRIVMTGTASDRAAIQDHVFSKAQKKTLERRFKDPADPLKLVIVRDMWLTGFDAPCCHTMYIDKPMEAHNLMQAIARVNRVFKDKQGGLVVDYIGIAAALKAALKTYTEARGKGQPTLRSSEALSKLMENLDKLRGLFHGFDYRKYETEAMKLLVPAANHVLGLDDGKKRFLDVMAAITKAYSLCSTLDEAAGVRKEIAFFTAVRAAIVKYTTVDRKRTEEEKHSALKQILDNAVLAEGVADVFTLAGLEKPNIGLLSDEFLEDLRKTPARNLALELLEKLLRDEIKAHTRTNVVQEKKYGDRLLETLRKYHNRAIETAQVIEEMIQMAKDFADELQRNRELGLNPDEVSFYMALAENESAVRELGDATLKKLATELTDQLRKSTTVDWQVRESVRAKLRILIRRLLRRYKYPPDLEKAAINLVLEQAETLSESWTNSSP